MKQVNMQAKERKWDFVRIKVTTEFMQYFFINGEKHLIISAGLTKDYSFVDLERDTGTLCYYFYFKMGNPPEGVEAKTITPEYEDITALIKL